MKAPNIRRYSFIKTSKDIEELKQLQALSSIETIIVTAGIAALVLGITIFQNAKGDIWWLLAGGILIITAFYPTWLILSSFLSKKSHTRVMVLETVTLLTGVQLTFVFVGFGTVYVVANPIVDGFLRTMGVMDLTPFIYFIVFKGIGLYTYFWMFHLVPDFEKRRFSLLINFKEKSLKFKIKNRARFNIFLRKNYYLLILIFYMISVIWCFLANEYFQIVLILIIGIIFYIIFWFIQRLSKQKNNDLRGGKKWQRLKKIIKRILKLKFLIG